ILAHRIVWSHVFLLLLITLRVRWFALRRILQQPRKLLILAATAILVSSNWFVYIWAVTHDQILQASLGYFINPLVIVLLGFVFLREQLARIEWAAVAIAAVGVAWLVVAAGVLPWISLCLAFSFGLYGLLRKVVGVDSVEGLAIETAVVLPVALVYLGGLKMQGTISFTVVSTETDLLLAAAGIVTATPLIWFAIAVRRLRLATIGILQYLAPTLQFLLAVLVYREPFGSDRLVAFLLIWVALALYTFGMVRRTTAHEEVDTVPAALSGRD
ncbi:MAG: EamA family transporter RarD, partial [Thermoanaerobaculia bacterium]|nr:EamA family transporter RarD [Thermoanaerobaculia bacterium]